MIPQIKFVLFSAVLILASTGLASGLETTSGSPKVAKAPDKTIIDLWTAKEAAFGWISLSIADGDLLKFRLGEHGEPGEIPAFQVRGPIYNRLKNLPTPDIPWGLNLIEGVDADLDGLPSTEKLFAFKCSFAWDPEHEPQHDKINRLKELRWLDYHTRGMPQLPKLYQLEAMDMESNAFDDQAISELISFTNLEYLSLRSSRKITPAGWEEVSREVISRLTNLRGLDLSSNKVSVKDLSQITGLKHLVHLNLRYTDTESADFARLPNLSQLKSLDLSGTRFDSILDADNSHKADNSVRPLANCRQLESLNLSGTGIGDAGLSHVENLKSLKKLDLSLTSVTDAGIGKSPLLRQLESLDVGWIKNISVETLSAIPADGPLRKLNLYQTNAGNQHVLAVSRLHKLRSLSLSDAKINSKAIVHLGQLKDLEELDLSGISLTNRMLSEFPELPQLRYLELSRTGIHDKDLAVLKKYPKLDSVGLSVTSVTDKGMEELAKLKSLGSVSLIDTRVTEAGQKKLLNAFPAIRLGR